MPFRQPSAERSRTKGAYLRNPIGSDPELALAKVESPSTVINLGTGDGVTVRELVTAFEKVL